MNGDKPTSDSGLPSAPLITIEEAARLSSTSPSTIRRMIKHGDLEVTYCGCHPRVVADSLFRRRGKRQNPGFEKCRAGRRSGTTSGFSGTRGGPR